MYIKKHKHLIIFFTLVLLFVIIPLILFPQYYGHDMASHLNRMHCISDNLKNGKLFYPIYQTTLDNYGYAFPLFYGDIFLYPVALLILLGIPDKYIAAIAIINCVCATLCASYFAATKILKDKTSAFVFTFLYTFSSYLSVNYFTRYSLGETYAAIFLPLVLLGFWSIFYDDKRYWIWLPLGLTGVVYSHVLSTVIIILILIIAAVFSINRVLKDILIIKLTLLSAVIFILLSAAFVFPMIEQLLSTTFVSTANQSSTIFGTLSERSMPTSWVFSDFILFNDLDNWSFYWIPNGIGLFPILTIVYALFACKSKNKIFYLVFAIGLFFLFATTRRFPWDALQNVFGIIQFPWRLMLYATLFLALASSILVKDNNNKVFVSLLCTLSLFSFFMASYRKFEENYKEKKAGFDYNYAYQNQIGTGEYLPAYKNENGEYIGYKEIKEYLLDREDTLTSNNLDDQQMNFLRKDNGIVVEYKENKKENTYIEVPLLMYKGYMAIDANNNIQLEVSYGDHNIIRVNLNEHEGSFVVGYHRTPVQIVSLSISAISLAVIIILLSSKKLKENYKSLVGK